MDFVELTTIAATILVSLIEGGGIVTAFSNWIGKGLADR